MAQSPNGKSDPTTQLATYQQGWQDLYTLMQHGRSFSGHERNCCFLNLSESDRIHFADISFVSGIDFPDDARSVAVTDWDLDGDQDFWVTNRTGPRVRMMLNSLPKRGHSLTIKLVGTSCNRDAIGARVTVFNDRQPLSPRTQTVRAGSGFMSQSSRWLHFGLGDANRIAKVEIRWPGQNETEMFAGLQANRRYTIRQGSGVVQATGNQNGSFRASSDESVDEVPSQTARTLLVGRVPLPPMHYSDRQGKRSRISQERGRPTLINVWTASCPACIHELQDWANAADRIREANLEILALTPQDGQTLTSTVATLDTLLERIAFPFQVGTIDDRSVEILTAFQNSFWDRHRSFAVPTSFLVDRFQRVVAMYRGRVDVNQLLSDAKLLNANGKVVRQNITNFQGRWFGPVNRPRILSMTNSLRKAGVTAIDYLEHCLQIQGKLPADDDYRWQPNELANLHFALGTELLTGKKPAEAMTQFANAIGLNPQHRGAHANLGAANFQASRWAKAEFHFGQALASDSHDIDILVNRGISRFQQNKLRPAITDFKAALKLDPEHLRANFNMALAMRATRNERLMITYFRKSLNLDPNLVEAKFHLAWALTSATDKTLRDGAEAVRIARELNAKTNSSEPSILNLLAATLAENGHFDEAVKTINRAIQIAKSKKQSGLVAQLQKSLSIYVQKASKNQRTKGAKP